MKIALRKVSLPRISSILRHSSGLRGVWNVAVWSDRETSIEGNVGCSERCAGGVVGLSPGESGFRWFGTTSFLSRSRIQSKYSRNYPKGNRKEVVEVRSGVGPGSSRVRHGPNLAFKALNQIGLKDSTKSVVLGCLLGDSTLQIVTGENDARLLFRISEMDEEYFQWKAAALKEISSLNSVHLGASNKFLFQSRAVDSLTRVYEVTHSNDELLIRKRWLNHMTPQSLAVWWCDAGYLVAGGRKGELCTDSFSEDRVLVLSKYLEDEWKVHAHVAQIKSTKNERSAKEPFVYRLSFRTEELKKFLRSCYRVSYRMGLVGNQKEKPKVDGTLQISHCVDLSSLPQLQELCNQVSCISMYDIANLALLPTLEDAESLCAELSYAQSHGLQCHFSKI